MITVEKIIEWSKPHVSTGGKRTILGNDIVDFSIVGGCNGLYGDFEKDFEVAVLDKKGKFMTKFFFETTDDVVPYLEGETLIQTLNSVLGENFQVFYQKLGGGGV